MPKINITKDWVVCINPNKLNPPQYPANIESLEKILLKTFKDKSFEYFDQTLIWKSLSVLFWHILQKNPLQWD